MKRNLSSQLTSLLLCAGLMGLAGCGTDATQTAPDATSDDTGGTTDAASDDTDVAAVDADGGGKDVGQADGQGADGSDTADGAADAAETTDDVAADVAETTADAVADAGDDAVDDGAADAAPDAVADASDATGDAGGDDGDSGSADGESDASTQPGKATFHATACQKDGDCLIPCATSGLCKEGKCTYFAKASMCLAPAGAGKVGCYPAGAKDAAQPCLSCNPTISNEQLSSLQTLLAINDANHGFEITDLTGGEGKLTWQLASKRSVSGGQSLYFGDPVAFHYANDQKVHAAATTKPLKVPSFAGVKPTLSFWLYLDTEQSDGYDLLTVSSVEGETVTGLWNSDAIGGSTHKVWKLIHVDVSALAGKDVRFRFEFDSKDGFVNAYEGAYIDDVSLRTGCCGALSDCNDGNACTADSCGPGSASAGLPVCSHAPKADCCASAVDCDDGKPCTLDLCPNPGGSCSHSQKPSCCASAADCDDKDACTIDHCPKAGSTCQHTDTCCKSDGECVSADSCLKGSCSGGECVFTSACCLKDGECDDINPCTVDTCSSGKCKQTASTAAGCCSPQPYSATFSGDLDGWVSDATITGLSWYQATFPHDLADKKGDGAALMGTPGIDLAGIIGSSNYVTLTSPEITLPPAQELKLSFQVMFDLSLKSTLQTVNVYILHKGKQTTLNSAITYAASGKDGWLPFQAETSSLAGQTFQIQLRGRIYGSGSGTTGKGIWLDDVKFEATCSPKSCINSSACPSVSQCLSGICTDGTCGYVDSCCASDADCVSSNLCIASKCSAGKCSFLQTKGCCMGAGDCNDGNLCTADVCPAPGQQCQAPTLPGCCLSSSECNDNNTCTDDTCIGNKCISKNSCCKADSDCSDGETKCTTDTCNANGKCVNTPTGASGCCTPVPFLDDFEKGPGSWTFTNSAGITKGWQVVGNALVFNSPLGALYYGDPSAGNYNFGDSNGTAVSPLILVPSGYKSELSFWVYMDTESGTAYDVMQVFMVEGTQKQSVFTKTAAGFSTGKWYQVKVDTSSKAGKSISLEIVFDSIDSVANSTKGAFVDDVKLTVACGG